MPIADAGAVTAISVARASPPSFVWYASVRLAGLPLVRVRDSYANGDGNILVKAAGLLTVADSRGEEMDQASLVRYLNEMIWFPAAYLGDFTYIELEITAIKYDVPAPS